MSNIGPWEIAIVFFLALLIFGPKKLPELGSSLGRTITGFKRGLEGTTEDLELATKEQATVDVSGEPETTANDTITRIETITAGVEPEMAHLERVSVDDCPGTSGALLATGPVILTAHADMPFSKPSTSQMRRCSGSFGADGAQTTEEVS